MTRYKKLSKEINQLDKVIEETARDLAEVQERVDRSWDELDSLWESLKVELLEGDKTSIKDVELAIETRKATNRRDSALFEALRERLPALEQQRKGLVDEQNEVLVDSAAKWFKAEIGTYEAYREDLLRTVRRLLAASHMLHQSSSKGRETSRGILGPAIKALPVIKLPSIRKFDLGAHYEDNFRDPSLVASAVEREEVLKEITK